MYWYYLSTANTSEISQTMEVVTDSNNAMSVEVRGVPARGYFFFPGRDGIGVLEFGDVSVSSSAPMLLL